MEELLMWEGRVAEVDSNGFTATLEDLTNLTNRGPGEQDTVVDGYFFLSEVPRLDRPLVVPGAVFYWSVGSHKSVLRFLRLERLHWWWLTTYY